MAMDKKESIKRLWADTFGDSPEYINMYFERVYSDADAMTLESDDRLVSALLLQPYKMLFHGEEVNVSYLCGAMTRRSARGHGFMSELLRNSLLAAAARGDLAVVLIPATSYLYYFYERSGFSTVFFKDCQRFTSQHAFDDVRGVYHKVTDHFDPKVYDAFHRFEMRRGCTILHSRRDLLNIIDDNRLDGGRMAVMADEDGNICAMAWAVEVDGVVKVRDLMGSNHDSRTAALHALREQYPSKPFVVMEPPVDETRRLTHYGMARMTDVNKCLCAVAAADSKLKLTVRVADPLIEANTGIYILADGVVTTMPYDASVKKLDLDVTIDVFTDIVFSSRQIGEILGFPSCRPVMSLMLE